MKKLLLSLLGVLATTLPAWAIGFTYTHNGVTFECEENEYWNDDVGSYVQYVYISGYGLKGDVVIPDSVTCDYDYEEYRGVVFPVKGIGDFKDNLDVTSVTLPSTLKWIVRNAFQGCKNLKSINFPESLETIGNQAFYDSGLESIDFSKCKSLTSIGEQAFYNTGVIDILLSEYIISNVTVGNEAFGGTTSPAKVAYPAGMNIDNWFGSDSDVVKIAYSSDDIIEGGIIYNSDKTNILYAGSSVTEWEAPADLTTIGDNAFRGCPHLYRVIMSPSVTTIGNDAFRDAYMYDDSLDDGENTPERMRKNILVVGPNVKSIGSGALYVKRPPSFACITPIVPPEVEGEPLTANWTGYWGEEIYFPDESTFQAYRDQKWVISPFASYPIPSPTGMTHSEISIFNGAAGETVQLSASLDGEGLFFTNIYWYSSDPTVATVDQTGLVTLVQNVGRSSASRAADGSTGPSCTIQARSLYADGPVYEVKIEAPVTGITIESTNSTLEVGKTLQLKAVLEPEEPTDKSVTWTSGDESVATVDEDGLVTGKSAGKVTITARSSNDYSDTIDLNVIVLPTAITVKDSGDESATEATLEVDETLQLSATLSPDDVTETTVTWTSGNPTVARVNGDGLVTALATGETTITGETINGLTAEFKVTVIKTPTSVTIGAADGITTLAVGNTLQLTANVEPADATDKSVTWSSDNEEVATVSTTGLVSAHSTGEVTISAKTANDIAAQYKLTVIEDPSTGIATVSGESIGVSVEGGEIIISGGVSAEVFDLSGKSVAVTTDGRVRGLEKGVYILRLADGRAVKVHVK